MIMESMDTLLAVDVGLKTGLALFGRDGRLRWYRSRKLGSAIRLRRIVHGLLDENPDIQWLVLEGGGALADIWEREARRRHIDVLPVCAETWRKRLLHPRQRRTGLAAKKNACLLARRFIEWSSAPRPTSLRVDTAESILIGIWAVLELGWLDAFPGEVKK